MGLRRLLSVFVGLCVFGVTLLLSVVPALAGVTHKPTGVSFGPFLAPGDVTVVQSSGDVLVVDGGAQRVERFTSAGVPASFSALGTNAIDGHGGGECATVPADCDETPQNGFELAGPGQAQVAVDESAGATKGEIYVTDSNHHVVDIFAPDGHYLGQLTGTHSTPFGTVCGVAVDQAGNVLVADENGQIHRFQGFTNPVTNNDSIGDIPVSSACELALDSTGDIFATQPFGGPVNKYDSAGDLQYALGSSNATGVAVDPASGDVYVAGESSVVQFDASSSIAPVELGSFGAGTVTSPAGVAVDGASGEVFVSDGATQSVVVFGAGVATPSVSTGAASGVSETAATVAGGVNPEGTVTEWQFEYGTEEGVYGSTAPASPQAAGSGTSEVPVSTGLSGLTAGTTYHYRLVGIGANGTTYGADQSFTTQAPPSIDSQSAEPIAKTTATLDAQINPFGAETTYHFEYGATESYGTSTGDKTLAAGWGDQAASAELSGLTSGATYHYRVIATNALGGPVAGADQTFTAVPAATFKTVYGVEAIYADGLTSSSATLHAEVNPLGDATTYHFEYGPTEAYGSSIPVPDGSVGEGSELVAVSQRISGLAAGTVFHFRVVASNTHGSVDSEDHTFKTASVAVETTCANAKIREEQHSTYLPDCRAYEKVSPEEKGNGDIVGDGETTIASTSGEAVAFSSRTPFGDEVGSGNSGQTQYVARRGGEGWATHAVTPPSRPEVSQIFTGKTLVEIFSDDLSTADVWGYDLPGGGETKYPRSNIYLEDTATRTIKRLTEVDKTHFTEFTEFENDWGCPPMLSMWRS